MPGGPGNGYPEYSDVRKRDLLQPALKKARENTYSEKEDISAFIYLSVLMTDSFFPPALISGFALRCPDFLPGLCPAVIQADGISEKAGFHIF